VTERDDGRLRTPDESAARSVRAWLRLGEHDFQLAPGETFVGRGAQCQLVLDDPLVSRSHACFVFDGTTVAIEDLGSANGVLVNGERLGPGKRSISSGDRVVIGQQTLQLFVSEGDTGKQQRSRARTLPSMKVAVDGKGSVNESTVNAEPFEPTRKGDALELLAGVADKVLALGRGEEAERILSSYLKNLLTVARTRGEVDPAVAQKAVTYAVRIAEATGKGAWVDYSLELYGVLKRPLPAPVVDRLYEVLRKLTPVSAAVYRQYLSAVRAAESELGPAERFLMRRLEGLESLGVLR